MKSGSVPYWKGQFKWIISHVGGEINEKADQEFRQCCTQWRHFSNDQNYEFADFFDLTIGFQKQGPGRRILPSFTDNIRFSMQLLNWINRCGVLTCINQISNVINALKQNVHSENHGYKACCDHNHCESSANAFDVLVKSVGHKNQINKMCNKRIAKQNESQQYFMIEIKALLRLLRANAQKYKTILRFL